MARSKVCTKCKLFVDADDKCPGCQNNKFSTNWQGRISVLDPERSSIAKHMHIERKGEFSIKVK